MLTVGHETMLFILRIMWKSLINVTESHKCLRKSGKVRTSVAKYMNNSYKRNIFIDTLSFWSINLLNGISMMIEIPSPLCNNNKCFIKQSTMPPYLCTYIEFNRKHLPLYWWTCGIISIWPIHQSHWLNSRLSENAFRIFGAASLELQYILFVCDMRCAFWLCVFKLKIYTPLIIRCTRSKWKC